MALTFEWDDEKSRSNQARHGVSFTEAVTVFADPRALTIYDQDHSSEHEDRFKTIGLSEKTRVLLVVHCDRSQNIRLISARKANATEKKLYDSQTP
ncbi:MAG: BrnT family toxin [Phycisphaeraceae bacterium]|nr:BrnT family toxin [Phycisphaeraceae bacterium]